jgi:DNA-binding LytR/AlgR family response regulator
MQSNLDIMIVEDDLIMSANLAENLYDLGYNKVSEARNSDEALSILVSQNISIVFMDIQLKGSTLDGIELSEEINKHYPTILIIFLTGFADKQNLERVSNISYHNFLVKPVSAQQLFASIQSALVGSRKNTSHSASYIACHFNNQNEEIFIRLQNDRYFNRIMVADIIYMMTNNKGIDIVTPNHTFFAYSSLGEILEKINNKNMVQIHKRYIVNRTHISSFSNTDIIMSNGKGLPLGRSYKKALIDLGFVFV